MTQVHLVTIVKGQRTFMYAYEKKEHAVKLCQCFADIFSIEYNDKSNTFDGETFGGISCMGFLSDIDIKKIWKVPDQEYIDFMVRL